MLEILNNISETLVLSKPYGVVCDPCSRNLNGIRLWRRSER